MKILKLRGDFKKMPDKNWKDVSKINKMVELGWSFVNHKEYKDVHGVKSSPVVAETKKVEKVQKIKKVKETKVEKKDKKRK